MLSSGSGQKSKSGDASLQEYEASVTDAVGVDGFSMLAFFYVCFFRVTREETDHIIQRQCGALGQIRHLCWLFQCRTSQYGIVHDARGCNKYVEVCCRGKILAVCWGYVVPRSWSFVVRGSIGDILSLCHARPRFETTVYFTNTSRWALGHLHKHRDALCLLDPHGTKDQVEARKNASPHASAAQTHADLCRCRVAARGTEQRAGARPRFFVIYD